MSCDFHFTYKGETTLKISDLNRSSGRTKIGNLDCQGGGTKKGKCGNDPCTLDAVSEISKMTFGQFAR